MNDEYKWENRINVLPCALKHNKSTNDKLIKCYYEKNRGLIDIYDKDNNLLHTFNEKGFYEFKTSLKPWKE